MQVRDVSEETQEINRVARLLMAEWERVEGKPVNVSYVATFADMARVIIADRKPKHGGNGEWARFAEVQAN